MFAVLKTAVRRLLGPSADEEGQALTEYALVLALVGLVAVVGLTLLGGHVTSVLTTVAPTP